MNLAQLRETPHLSVSSINDYIDCGLLFKFSRIDKLTPEFKADALVFGTAIHAVLAEFYEALKTSIRLSAKQMQEIFEIHWRRLAFEREDIQYKPDKDYDTMLLEGKELLSIFHQKIPVDEAKIIGIEQAFHFWLEGLPIPIIGSFDLLLKDAADVLTIVDHKTSGKSYSNQDVDKNFQLTVYNLAAKLNGFNYREILLRFDVLIKTKTPKFEQFYSTRSELEERKAIKKILAVYEGIQKGVFIPNETSWKCAGCAFKKACEAWFAGGGDGQE